MNTDQPTAPAKTHLRVCRCNALVVGMNACPHCNAGWAEVLVPVTEYIRLQDVLAIIDAAGEEWGDRARARKSKTFSAYVIAALDLRGRITEAIANENQPER